MSKPGAEPLPLPASTEPEPPPQVENTSTAAPVKASFERQTFSVSRELEYFTDRELSMQLGASRDEWPVALAKELCDNGLDACEAEGISPEITISVGPDYFSVADNGPGLPEKVLRDSLNYMVRVSDKAHYVSPSRGQLGNALKCVWAAPFVADGKRGVVEVTTRGTTYTVTVEVDQIAQKPAITIAAAPCPNVKKGTFVKIHWPDIASLMNGGGYGFYKLASELVAFNPHARLDIVEGERTVSSPPTDPLWKKWLPLWPTSPHWYSTSTLSNLLGAYVSNGSREKSVREFVSGFAGLTGSAKQRRVTEASGLGGLRLADLVTNNAIDGGKCSRLLAAMREESRPVKPKDLGIIGEAHFTEQFDDAADSFRYRKATGTTADGLPYVVETAFGVTTETERRIVQGFNYTRASSVELPDSVQHALNQTRADYHDPVQFILHVACPRLEFTDRAKTQITLPQEIETALVKCIGHVGRDWKVTKRKAARDNRVSERNVEEMRRRQRSQTYSIKKAAEKTMPAAYAKASGNKSFSPNARQVMYAARPLVLQLTNGKAWKQSSYFTQRLLLDFTTEHPEATADWDILFDARGHFVEPHTEERIDLGTEAVRNYVERWTRKSQQTCGPSNRFKFALFLEKEGFNSQLEQANIAQRFDVAILSTKGMSVTSARTLVERMSDEGVTTLVMHDFDKSGFSIMNTLRSDTRRYQFEKAPKVVDIGLRLEDVKRLKLESEPVEYDDDKDPRENLAASGATKAEQDFLVQRSPSGKWTGQRVELNALSAPDFIKFVEDKLTQAGCSKVVPNSALLGAAYKDCVRSAFVEQKIAKIKAEAMLEAETLKILVPNGIAKIVRKRIQGTALSWNQAVIDLRKELAA